MAIPFLQSKLLAPLSGISHGFYTRRGGVSLNGFDSLNCSLFTGDELNAVKSNRDRIVRQLGGKVLFSNRQIHSNIVRVVDEKDDPEDIVEADGLVTKSVGVGIGALGADCAPIMFVDEAARIVGVAHGGWKGAVDGITDAVVETMCQLGSKPGSLNCVIGPGIQLVSYEVGQEFKDHFLSRSPIPAESCFSPDLQTGNQHFDLPKYIESRLRAVGITRIDRFEDDTYQEADRFFSYRRSCHLGKKQYGCQISVVCLI